MGRLRLLGCALLATTALALGAAAPATAGGFSCTQMPPSGGVALPGSPYRFQTVTVGRRHRLTIVEQIRRRGGLLGRRWLLGGAWHLSAPAYDREGTGLAAHAPRAAEGTAMTGIAAAFRTTAGAAFPAVSGWCCRARSAAGP